MRADLHAAGYALLRGALTAEACRAWADTLPDTPARAGGQRGIPDTVAAREVMGALDGLAQSLLQAPASAVRAILFDKTPQSNWAVPWHQDLGIPVRERHECAGFRAWSMKEGVWHVQPPHAVLEGMLTLRLHLDDCGNDNAPLHVLPGSHALGRLDDGRCATGLRKAERWPARRMRVTFWRCVPACCTPRSRQRSRDGGACCMSNTLRMNCPRP